MCDDTRELLGIYTQLDMIGNPNSSHSKGRQSDRDIRRAKKQVAALIHAEPGEIHFTANATEANMLAARILHSSGRTILSDYMEHESMARAMISSWMPMFPAQRSGTVSLERFLGMLMTQDTELSSRYAVSVMWVNNETGAVNPIREIGCHCRKAGIPFHTDATQAIGHIPVDVREDHVDMLSMSAHKFGGPPGSGALYISNRLRKRLPACDLVDVPRGTPNVPAIAGMGAAAEHITRLGLETIVPTYEGLRRAFLTRLRYSMHLPYQINGPRDSGSSIISLTIPGIDGSTMLTTLDQKLGVCVSTGSACTSGNGKPSHVLTAMGLSEEDASCTIRVSMGEPTTTQDVIAGADAVAEAADRIVDCFKHFS